MKKKEKWAAVVEVKAKEFKIKNWDKTYLMTKKKNRKQILKQKSYIIVLVTVSQLEEVEEV